MRLLGAVTLAVCLATAANAEELHVALAGETGILHCNAGSRDVYFANPAGRAIRLKAVEIWMGMSEHGEADFWGWAFVHDPATGPDRLLMAVGWDHYQEPTGPSNYRKSYAPDWVSLAAGQYLRLHGGCTGYPGITANVALFIEYTIP